MENGEIRLLEDSIPLNESTQNLEQVIISARWSVQNFVQIRLLETSR